eukprot:2290643-Ditylum_brightwellii.AAC.2
MKGNAVAMTVAGRALQYAAERDMLPAKNGANSNASEYFVTTLNYPIPNSNVHNMKDTEDVLHSDSNNDISSSVVYVPSEPQEQSKRKEDEPSDQSERNEGESAETSHASSAEAATPTSVPLPNCVPAPLPGPHIIPPSTNKISI